MTFASPRAAALGVSYRRMGEQDLPFVSALYASTRAAEMAATGWPQEMIDRFLAQQHAAQHHHYRAYFPAADWLIVEADDAPVGRVYLDRRETDIHLIDISLVEQRRGNGIGTAIMEDLLDLARAEGKTLSLFVEPNNPARRLYERLGFAGGEVSGAYEAMLWGPARVP
jgi:ribosomal protein S18 acetylase RimI-like enzyme